MARSAADGKRKPRIENYPFKPGIPHEIEVVSLETTFAQTKNTVTIPHRTEFYHVLWFRKGKATMLVDFNSIPVGPDSMVFIGKGRVLMFDKAGVYDGLAMRFTDAFFCRNAEDSRFLFGTPLFNAFNESPIVPAKSQTPLFSALFRQIQSEAAGKGDAYQHLVLQNLVHNLLVSGERLLIGGAAPEIKTGEDMEYGQKFRQHLDREFRKRKRVAQYAELMHMTEKRLSKAITRLYGKPPKELIDERIVLEAKRLLLYGPSSVKEITDELGFDEPTNFIKYFRKHAAQTPARFRARYLG
jgi:AraC family transcriptional regulator, transcriptional activator of pobA